MKDKIQSIESRIIEIVGDDLDNFNGWESDKNRRETVKSLLSERCAILNNMFQPTEENNKRFRRVNDELFRLSKSLEQMLQRIAYKKDLLLDSPDFDDDYELEGTLKFVFNDKDSILTLPDDVLYGSNFPVMIKALYELYSDGFADSIVTVNEHHGILDDGQSWNEPPFMGHSEYDNIIICYAVHDLTSHKLYSIPDLLRLNDFWAEVNFKIQSITDQSGHHFKFDK